MIPYMLQVEPSRRPGVLEVNHFLQGQLWKCGEGTSQSEECHSKMISFEQSKKHKKMCLLIDAFVVPGRRQQFSSGNPMEHSRILAPTKRHFKAINAEWLGTGENGLPMMKTTENPELSLAS